MTATPLDQPALRYPPETAASGGLVDGHGRECMVMFRDGTWCLCKVLGWRHEPGGWAVELQWGVSGRIASGWYWYEPGKMSDAED